MITKSELIDYAVEHNIITYDKEIDKVTFIDTGLTTSSDIFLEAYRQTTGQSFECIHDEHVSCFSLIRCTECGTYIFEHYDEDYEPNLRCPVCTDYKTNFKYFTVKDIEEDENKQRVIDMYKDFARMAKEVDERYVKRGGLYDWQKTHKKTIFKGEKYVVDIQFTGHDKWDLQAEINVWKRKDINDIGMTCKHHITIPISPSTIIFFIKNKIKCKVTWDNV
jgi:hypothetical protein